MLSFMFAVRMRSNFFSSSSVALQWEAKATQVRPDKLSCSYVSLTLGAGFKHIKKIFLL